MANLVQRGETMDANESGQMEAASLLSHEHGGRLVVRSHLDRRARGQSEV